MFIFLALQLRSFLQEILFPPFVKSVSFRKALPLHLLRLKIDLVITLTIALTIFYHFGLPCNYQILSRPFSIASSTWISRCKQLCFRALHRITQLFQSLPRAHLQSRRWVTLRLFPASSSTFRVFTSRFTSF